MAPRGKPAEPETPKKWVIRWGDHVLREQDMTLGDLEDIEERTGKNWFTINPMRDAKHAVAIVSTMVARETGRDYDEVRAEVRATGNEVFFDSYGMEDDTLPDVYQDGHPPVAGRQTATSSGSPQARGSGRRK
jgi:hypothetical protein